MIKRVFAIDLTTCPQCGGPLAILTAIEEPSVIIKILSHLGLPTRATKSPGPPRRILPDSLIPPPDSGSVPEADRSPLPICPAHTPQASDMWA